jgi:3-phosphoshikimate 1-carboxyvinyltransferase
MPVRCDEPRPLAVPFAPRGLAGSVAAPPSKSVTQRALVAAAAAGAGARVLRPLDAEDPRLLAAALGAAGARFVWEGEEVRCERGLPTDAAGGAAEIRMGNNGTGARFMLAQLAATPGTWVLDGVARLRERPIAPLAEALRSLGAEIAPAAGAALRLPLRVSGRSLAGGEVGLDASASSQFASALLLLGTRLPRGITVRLTGAPPSRPYLDLTVDVLRAFGADAAWDAAMLVASAARGGLRPAAYTVEGDWSAAAFPLAGAAVAGGEVEVLGVSAASRQGDAAVLALLAAAGCGVAATPGGVRVRGPAVRPLAAHLADAPDLFPALAVVAAAAGGELTGLAGLATKESDRLRVMADNLAAIGFAVEAGAGTFAARGGVPARSAAAAPLPCAADHRVAMALAVAGAAVPGVTIDDAACVAKSWPGFWDAWSAAIAGPR